MFTSSQASKRKQISSDEDDEHAVTQIDDSDSDAYVVEDSDDSDYGAAAAAAPAKRVSSTFFFSFRFIGLSVFGSRILAKDHGLVTVQRNRVLDRHPSYPLP